MSLYPFFDDYYHHRPTHRPSRILDQHFGLGISPEDFLEALTVPRMSLRCPAGYTRPWRTETSRQDSGSTVSLDKDRFQANLDVQQFKPEEITVKLIDENTVMIEGKHEEKEDDHGFISRHFMRKYVLPKTCDASQLQSKLSSDGVLTITAPTKNQQIEHKEIPIQQTGQPVKRVEGKAEEKNES
ncbi:hypothetical protein JTB14_038248 [Gonioctena quinquepunctata]|nr:hypothetical protein JTB14_038248 [Gonioctena quinquepunctata]